MFATFKKLGPGLIFAGAAIGVSHLVQSTRAGADFGFGLLWALLLVNLFKYPFFQFGPRYAMATGESLVDGYKRMGKGILITYFILTFATMFTIQTAVTIVTASLASNLFGDFTALNVLGVSLSSIQIWTVLLLFICGIILSIGKYRFLDVLMKVIIITLTLSTIVTVVSSVNQYDGILNFQQIFPEESSWVFLIAFMGWMPAPLDISIWHSLWSLEKTKIDSKANPKSALFDFNIGYIMTIILGICFLSLGALVMFNSGENLSTDASLFSQQLISMYTKSLGNWSYIFIGLAAFTTMFSTTLTTFDGSPRVMAKTTLLLFKNIQKNTYFHWLLVLFLGSIIIFFFLSAELGNLVKFATVLSFLTAPFYAIINYKLMTGNHVPKAWRPSIHMKILSLFGILFLVGFGLWYLTIL